MMFNHKLQTRNFRSKSCNYYFKITLPTSNQYYILTIWYSWSHTYLFFLAFLSTLASSRLLNTWGRETPVSRVIMHSSDQTCHPQHYFTVEKHSVYCNMDSESRIPCHNQMESFLLIAARMWYKKSTSTDIRHANYHLYLRSQVR